MILDDTGMVVVGPERLARTDCGTARTLNDPRPSRCQGKGQGRLRFERLPNDQTVLIARAPVSLDAIPTRFLGCATQRAQGTGISTCRGTGHSHLVDLDLLGTVTAVLGALGRGI